MSTRPLPDAPLPPPPGYRPGNPRATALYQAIRDHRRASDTAIHLTEHVLPRVPYRLRFLL